MKFGKQLAMSLKKNLIVNLYTIKKYLKLKKSTQKQDFGVFLYEYKLQELSSYIIHHILGMFTSLTIIYI